MTYEKLQQIKHLDSSIKTLEEIIRNLREMLSFPFLPYIIRDRYFLSYQTYPKSVNIHPDIAHKMIQESINRYNSELIKYKEELAKI